MRCIVKHISGIVGAEDGDVAVNGLFPDEKQLQPVEDGDCQAVIADSVNPEQGEIVVRDSQGNSAEPTPADNSAYERKCGDSPLPSNLIQVVEYSLSLGPGVPKQKKARSQFCGAMFCQSGRGSISASNCGSWSPLWPERLGTYPIGGLTSDLPRKARDTIAGMPRSVAETVDRAQKACTAGNTAATKRADASQGAAKLKRSMVRAMGTYNESAAKLRKTVE